jgi:hypothetical protein
MAIWKKLVARGEPVLRHLPAVATMVEVGVFAADLAVYLLERRPELTWHGIDDWAGSDLRSAAHRDTGDVYAKMSQADQDGLLSHALARLAPYGERVRVWRESSPMAAHRFAEGSIDLVFVDADHSRDGCLADLKGWWPVVKPDGWLGGHDYLNSDRRFTFGVNLAVEEFSRYMSLPIEADGGTTFWFRKPLPRVCPRSGGPWSAGKASMKSATAGAFGPSPGR